MPLYFNQLYYIEEGLAKIGGLVSDSDGSLISKMSDNNSIKFFIIITPFSTKTKTPSADACAQAYIQAACFFRVV